MCKEEIVIENENNEEIEAIEDIYFEADVDASDAVDRDIENYREQLLVEDYEENREYHDVDGALLKTYWRE
tara:strand:- start:9 stop:221 length:213 start_codon:yes stop_codon:yes gene_type:complete